MLEYMIIILLFPYKNKYMKIMNLKFIVKVKYI